MNWVLIVVVHVGSMGSEDSNAITAVPGFTSKVSCEAQATAVKGLMSGTVKEIRAKCLEVK